MTDSWMDDPAIQAAALEGWMSNPVRPMVEAHGVEGVRAALATTDLASWLLECIAEDEGDLWFAGEISEVRDVQGITIAGGADAINTALQQRVAECDAKRRRVEHITDQLEQWRMGRHDSEDREKAVDGLEDLLKLEALPMADRPEYRTEWRPE